MPGAITDKFRIASGSTRPVVATLALAKAAGATTAELTVATGWNTTTALDYVMYRRKLNTTTGKYEEIAGTRIEGKAVLTGTTLSSMTIEGTEPASGYAADGNTVILQAATAQWADDLIGGILLEHTQTGAHALATNSTINGSKFITALNDTNGNELLKVAPTASAVNEITVGNATTGNNGYLQASGNDANLGINLITKGTGEHQINGTPFSGAWQTWTPTWTNLTVSNGTVTARYKQIGKTVVVRLGLLFGTTSDVLGDIAFSLPVPTAADYRSFDKLGEAHFHDVGATVYMGTVFWSAASTATLRYKTVVGSNIVFAPWTTTLPFDTAPGDTFSIMLTYEAA